MMADALMKYETLDADQIDDIMSGKQPRDPEGWDENGESSAKKADGLKKDDAPNGEPPAKPA